MPAIVRIGDPVSCGDVMAQGSANVFANGIPVSRENSDLTAGHCFLPTVVSSGSDSVVYANNIPVVRVGDPIVPHTCPPPPETHGGNLSAGSPNVYVDSGGGSGAIIDNNPPAPPSTPGLNPSSPFKITIADIHIYESNDDPDGTLLGPPSGVTIQQMVPVTEDDTPPPSNPNPPQNCTDIELLPDTYDWSTDPTYSSFQDFAQSVTLSPNFTAWDMFSCAVSYYEFTPGNPQACGLTQKQILLNMCYHAKTVLEPMLARYGTFTITSGFRNKSGGSQHNKGQATDIQFLNLHNKRDTGDQYFATAQDIRDNINFDQMILEWFGKNPWIHISSNSTNHRHSVLTQVSSNSYQPGLKLLRKG